MSSAGPKVHAWGPAFEPPLSGVCCVSFVFSNPSSLLTDLMWFMFGFSDLEETLVVLPFAYVVPLLGLLDNWLKVTEREREREVCF